MIGLKETQEPSEHIRNRSKSMFVKTIGYGEFRVTPRELGKVKRIVTFHLSARGVSISCQEEDSGDDCPANGFRRHCSHVEAAIKRLLANEKRRKTKEKKHG